MSFTHLGELLVIISPNTVSASFSQLYTWQTLSLLFLSICPSFFISMFQLWYFLQVLFSISPSFQLCHNYSKLSVELLIFVIVFFLVLEFMFGYFYWFKLTCEIFHFVTYLIEPINHFRPLSDKPISGPTEGLSSSLSCLLDMLDSKLDFSKRIIEIECCFLLSEQFHFGLWWAVEWDITT